MKRRLLIGGAVLFSTVACDTESPAEPEGCDACVAQGGSGGSGGGSGGAGGSGESGGGAGEHDAAVHAEDGAVSSHDAVVHGHDAAVHSPDAAVHGPDAAVHGPDAAVHGPDAAVHGPDAVVHGPDAVVHGHDAAVHIDAGVVNHCLSQLGQACPNGGDGCCDAAGTAQSTCGADANGHLVWTAVPQDGSCVCDQSGAVPQVFCAVPGFIGLTRVGLPRRAAQRLRRA